MHVVSRNAWWEKPEKFRCGELGNSPSFHSESLIPCVFLPMIRTAEIQMQTKTLHMPQFLQYQEAHIFERLSAL